MSDSLADAERLAAVAAKSGKVAMAGHTRRFNPSHQWIHKRIRAGELKVQQMDVQTYFFRRKNLNALGQPRSWTDHSSGTTRPTRGPVPLSDRRDLLGGPRRPGADAPGAGNRHGHVDPDEGPVRRVCTLSLSFNNDGPLGTFFRYICDNGTYIARYDDLVDGKEQPIDVSKVDVSLNGIELQDREFFAAIREGREPNSSVAQVLPAYQTLDKIEKSLL
jgi:2-hydroxy-4-carboxymuconate semialdehyde hemiacetal dehydrogenase